MALMLGIDHSRPRQFLVIIGREEVLTCELARRDCLARKVVSGGQEVGRSCQRRQGVEAAWHRDRLGKGD